MKAAYDSTSRFPTMESRRRRFILIATITVILFLFYTHSGHPSTISTALHAGLDHFLQLPTLEAANGTLGFGAIVAVSQLTSVRRKSLLLAANITELEITIPDQPVWTDSDVDHLRTRNGSTLSRGSALAWLGHLNVLRWFMASGLETMLILEDDVDWDIHLRTSQAPKVAAAVRTLLYENNNPQHQDPQKPLQPPKIVSPEQAGGYWGPSDQWDIMYLGHCGDMFKPTSWENTTLVPRAIFDDTTLPAPEYMHILTRRFLRDLGIPVSTRAVHKSVSPLCTFGFALSRAGASRLLADASQESEGGTPAYDVRVLEACRDLGYRCWSANPELFHHQDAPSEIAIVNANKVKDHNTKDYSRKAATPLGAGVDAEGRLQGAAPNIACGIRGASFWTEDPDTVDYLREVVGRQGKCLRDQMAEDMSIWPRR